MAGHVCPRRDLMRLFPTEPEGEDAAENTEADDTSATKIVQAYIELDKTPKNVRAFKRKWKVTDEQYSQIQAAFNLMSMVKLFREAERDGEELGTISTTLQNKLIEFLGKLGTEEMIQTVLMLAYEAYRFDKSKRGE